MQRRLTLALLLTALASILLVGFGVLAMAQISARSNAETRVIERLPALTIQGQADRNERGRGELRRAFAFERIEPIAVDDAGNVKFAGERRGPEREPIELTLNEEQTQAFLAEETVLISEDRSVIGLRKFESVVRRPAGADGVLVEERVSAIGRQSAVWFLVSSLFVLAGAAAAGAWLARRLTQPIQQIKQTTSAIAGGDLAARAEVSGSDEVADLANEVNQMAGDLQRSRSLDRQFLMSVSHDLKTPLTAIAGYGEALSDGAIDDPERVGGVIQNHARRLDRLVGDLLDLARLDANRFTLNVTTFDASTVVGRTTAGLQQKASDLNVELVFDASPGAQTVGDPDRTEQAVSNLIENALRFARNQVDVTVSQSVEWTVISVSDDGPGIAQEDQDYIFDRLYTGKAQPEQAENSTGLGLAIVKELANAMGGQTQVATSASDGAQLIMRLPRAK